MLKILRCLQFVWTAMLVDATTLKHWKRESLDILGTLISVLITITSVSTKAWTCGCCWAGLSLAPGELWLSPKLCGSTSWLSSTYYVKASVLKQTRVLLEMAKTYLFVFLSFMFPLLHHFLADDFRTLLELLRCFGIIIGLYQRLFCN